MGSRRVIERREIDLTLTDMDGPPLITLYAPDEPVADWQIVAIWLVCAAVCGLWTGFLIYLAFGR